MYPNDPALIELKPSQGLRKEITWKEFDERLGEIVIAVIDPKPGETLTEEEVNQFCEQNLPRYKRPRRIVFDHVPRNPTGKIEKPKLRQKYPHLPG